MAANECLRIAASKIGYYAPDDPQPGSEAGRWMAKRTGASWLAGPSTSVWWCMCFASMCVYEAGGSLPGGPSFNTDYTIAKARAAGQLVGRAEAQPGDLVIYDWDGNGATDHVGIVERAYRSYVQTIEGNTSSGAHGSQSAGNGVWRRTRSWDDVAAIVRPTWSSQGSRVKRVNVAVKRGGVEVDGYWGETTTRALQGLLGTPVDGVVSSQSRAWQRVMPGLTSGWEWVDEDAAEGSQLVARLQREWGVEADGLIGPGTVTAMQRHFGTPADGKLDEESLAVMALQRWINRKVGA